MRKNKPLPPQWSNSYWIKLYRNLQIRKQSSLRKQYGIFVACRSIADSQTFFLAKRPQRRGARGKRLFSQDTINFIYIQLEITGRYGVQRNKTPQSYYSLFPQHLKLQSIVVDQSWIHFYLIKPDQLPGVQSTIIILKREGPGYQWSKMRRVLWEGQTNLSWPVSLFG